MQTSTATAARQLVPRTPDLDFSAPAVPRHWFGGNMVATHLTNGVNLLFPSGERFFVRSVHQYLPRITDARLRAQIKGFSGQEGRHAKEHERFFRTLQEQGYEIDRFLRFYETASARIEAVSPPALRLSVTAACEHFTALMAADALRDHVLDAAHPTMRALLLWHAAEEIEHRAVAFDVLQTVAPSYALRMAGLALATTLLGGFWVMGALSLMRQEHASPARVLRKWREAGDEADIHTVFIRGIRDYIRRDFHPSQADIDRLADDYIASIGLSAA